MRGKNILFNAIFGLLSQVIMIVIQFITRIFFLKYIGDVVLGLDGTLVSLLNIISLAEAGFSTSMVVFLVEPLQKKDFKKVNRYISILRVVYLSIAILYLAAGVIIVPFLGMFVKGIILTKNIYLYYLILVFNGAFSYFGAYRGVVLQADHKTYILKNIQTFFLIMFGVIQILSIVCTADYLVYLLIKLAQTIVGNMSVFLFCGKKYAYLKKSTFDKDVFKEVKQAVKNLFAGQVAGYIYGSSDAIIISAFLGVIQVAYYNNYFLIANGLKALFASIFVAMVPMLRGNIVDKNQDNRKEFFFIYTYACSVITVLMIVIAFTIIQRFIVLWIGDKYILSIDIFALMLADLFICNIQLPLGDYIIASGQFSKSKYPDIVGAFTNIIFSVAFVKYMGMYGVLLGTVLSRLIQWGVRLYIVTRYCLNTNTKIIMKYIVFIGEVLLIVLLLANISSMVSRWVLLGNIFFALIIDGLIALIMGIIGVILITLCNEDVRLYINNRFH